MKTWHNSDKWPNGGEQTKANTFLLDPAQSPKWFLQKDSQERERETKRTQGLLYFSPFSPLVKSDSSVCLSATPRLLYASMLLYYCTLRSRKPAAASGPTYDLHRHLANGINDSLETETAGNTETETQKVQEDWTTEIGPEMQIKY